MALGFGHEGEGGGVEDAGGKGLEVVCYPVVGRGAGWDVETEEAVEGAVVGELWLQMWCRLEEACAPAGGGNGGLLELFGRHCIVKGC